MDATYKNKFDMLSDKASCLNESDMQSLFDYVEFLISRHFDTKHNTTIQKVLPIDCADETDYLLRCEANKKHLYKSLEQVSKRKVHTIDVEDP